MNESQFGDLDLEIAVDEGLSGAAWEVWSAEHPDAAEEIILARRVRAIMAQLCHASIAVPEDFEARLLARVRQDQTTLDLLELALDGAHRVLLEMLTALMQLWPRPVAPAR